MTDNYFHTIVLMVCPSIRVDGSVTGATIINVTTILMA